MGWIINLFTDFFMAFGFLVFCGFIVTLAFFDGKVSDISTGWLFFPPLIFAWLRGEFYHWTRES